MDNFHLKNYIQERKQIVDQYLDSLLPEPHGPSGKVIEAMRYSISAGGKRVRPILMMAACEAVGGDFNKIMPAACAMECVHTYSLIHDDLPAMDDDDLRRGKPTCHKVFGEAIAILAGDGLLTYAFELMTHPELLTSVNGDLVNRAISIFAKAAGVSGMVGGQTADILFEGRDVDGNTLAYIHRHKTGALIRASVEMGALLGEGEVVQVEGLSKFGTALGLAFQIVDDLLDVIGDEKKLGKPVGSDERNRKATYPALFGIEETKRRAQELKNEALKALEPFGHEADPLRAIAIYVVERDR